MTVSTYGPLFEGAKITPEIRKAAQRAMDYGMFRIQARSPVRTGAMRSGWQMNLEGYGVRITNNVPYTIYNEMGTRKMVARPMATPTVPEMQTVFAKELSQLISRKLAAKIVGTPTEFIKAADSNDEAAFLNLTQGTRGSELGGTGFKSTGKNPARLNNSQRKAYERTFGKAFTRPPGKLESPKASRVGATRI